MDKGYVEAHVVSPRECDAAGRMRADAWFTWFQNAALEHLRIMDLERHGAMPDNIVWVLLDVQASGLSNYVKAGDELRLITSPTPSMHWLYPRAYEASHADGRPVVSATTTWVLMDAVTRRMTRNAEIHTMHNNEARGLTSVRFQPPAILDAPTAIRAFEPSPEDIDLNGHVNNARYIAWLENTLTDAGYELLSVGAQYKSEILPGMALISEFAADGDRYSYQVFAQAGTEPPPQEERKLCFLAAGACTRRNVH
jgi:acyl-ACP thioesterase